MKENFRAYFPHYLTDKGIVRFYNYGGKGVKSVNE